MRKKKDRRRRSPQGEKDKAREGENKTTIWNGWNGTLGKTYTCANIPYTHVCVVVDIQLLHLRIIISVYNCNSARQAVHVII